MASSAEITTINSFTDGAWHFVVARVDRDAALIQLFVDNVQQDIQQVTNSGGVINGKDLQIGCLTSLSGSSITDNVIGDYSYGYHTFIGDIDELKFFGCALTDQAIADLYVLTNSVETVVLSSSSSDQFILFPNPAESRESVTISTTRSIQSIELSDAQGKKMWEQTLNDDRKFTLPALESGMYFVKVITEQGSSVQKLIAK